MGKPKKITLKKTYPQLFNLSQIDKYDKCAIEDQFADLAAQCLGALQVHDTAWIPGVGLVPTRWARLEPK